MKLKIYLCVIVFVLCIFSVKSVVDCDDLNSRDDLIEDYFLKGFAYAAIVKALELVHGIYLSLKTVKRVLSRKSLKRRHRFYSDDYLLEVIKAVQLELEGSGKCLGYKTLWKRLVMKQIAIPQRKVLQLLHILDEDGVRCRKRRRLCRRQYVNPGPDFSWHIDGYDKLKPFGFPIHGCIDGYSRHVIWLKVGKTNNNPVVVGKYFTEAALQLNSLPCVIRADKGTENVHVKRIQVHFRSQQRDVLSGENSFVYGKSTGNQRIEAFWGQLRKHCVQFWMDLFKDMTSLGLLNMSDKVDALLLRFCFLDLLRKDLDQMKGEWNVHDIRRNRQAETQAGKPHLMYTCPEMFGTYTYRKEFDRNEMNVMDDTLFHQYDNEDHPEQFVTFVKDLIGDHQQPKDVKEGMSLYRQVKRCIRRLENHEPNN